MADQDMSKLNATSTTSATDGAGSTSAIFDGDSGDTVSKGETDGASAGGTAVGDKRRRDSNESDIIDLPDLNWRARLRSIRGRSSSVPCAPRGTRRGRGRGRGRSAVSELSIPDATILTSGAPIARGHGHAGVVDPEVSAFHNSELEERPPLRCGIPKLEAGVCEGRVKRGV